MPDEEPAIASEPALITSIENMNMEPMSQFKLGILENGPLSVRIAGFLCKFPDFPKLVLRVTKKGSQRIKPSTPVRN